MRAILDTSVLVASALPALDDELAISIVSLAELHFGVLVAGPDDVRAERLRRVALIERLFDPLPVDERVARSYGHLAATVAKVGRNPRGRIMDLLIAATAHAHEARLYTRNAADLQGLDGLLEIVPI